MITTARVDEWLHALPKTEATAIIDTVATVAADPEAPSPRCRRLASNLYEARHTLPHRRQARVMFGYRAGEPVLVTALTKKTNAATSPPLNRRHRRLPHDQSHHRE